MRYENRVAVIAATGGSICLATARKMKEEGAKVALLSSCPKVEAAAAEIPDILFIHVDDFTNDDEMAAVSAKVLETYGTVDVLVTDMYAAPPEGAWNEVDEAVFRPVIDKILTGNQTTIKYFLPVMEEKQYGRIVLVTSIAGRIGVPGANFATTLAYAGITGIIRNVATTEGKNLVMCNGVAVGPIEGHYMEPKVAEAAKPVYGRPGTADDVAYAIMYLSDEYASWNTGEIIDMNGGYFAI